MNKIPSINRIFWIIIFLSGFFISAYLEWQDVQSSALGWFLFTGLWSAFCGICFSISDWLFHK